jgi:hypothetical protein
MNLEAQLVTVSELSGQERDCMFALMDRYYAGMKRDFFNADLDEKHWAILLRDSDSNVICGFSTQMLMDFTVDGASMHALFSGDTIVEQRCWGQSVLAQAWGRLALELINRFPRGSLYWFLISKGYKTYRYLPLFFREYYPRHATPTPPWAKSVIDVLGRQKYPRAYDSSAGIIRAGATACRLRRDVAAVTFAKLRDPAVSFFVETNPGHELGDELCCIAPLTRENFSHAAARPLRRGQALQVAVG